MTKDIKIDGENTCFRYDNSSRDWIAEFTEEELRQFVKRIRKRAKEEVK